MDTMTRLAALAADCIHTLWPDAEGLPGAEDLKNLDSSEENSSAPKLEEG